MTFAGGLIYLISLSSLKMQYYVNFKKPIIRLYIFIILIFMILNPYTVVGRPGIVTALLLAIYAVVKYSSISFFSRSFPVFLIMLAIGTWGSFISYINNIGQLNHLFAVVSLMVYSLSVEGFWRFCQNNKVDFYEIIYLSSVVIVFNSLIVILEVYSPLIRAIIEGFLAPAGNIDWSTGFRYRGLSGSGGAGLSIASPIALSCILYLYEIKKVRILFTVISSLVILIALFNIGRTGLALMSIPIGIFCIFQLRKILKDPSGIIRFIFVTIIIVSPIYYNYELLKYYLNNKFGEGFTDYAFGFLLKGEEGLKEEGTLSVLVSFNSVIPTDFPEALIGYGFYGGGDFTPWTDSGYARMFLSVGLIMGLLFYLCFYLIYIHKIKNHLFLFYSILTILIISEYKEPLLYSGVGARIFILLLIFYYCKEKMDKKNNFQK